MCLDFDTTTPCSASSCVGDVLTTYDKCDGNGSCLGDATMSSCNGYTCNGNVCKTTCSTASDCAPGYTCAGGVCLLTPGQACTGNNQCASNICDVAGTGNCCTAACITGGTCGATSCDTSGNCVYPTTACGGTCPVGTNQHTPAGSCTGGSCSTNTTACANNLLCSGDGMNCLLTCGSNSPVGDANCVPLHYCNGMSCVATKGSGAACTRNGQCTSGACNGSTCQ
jgi:hypothetical protein